ncbi:aspartyl-phosphate phosphatase Spo0E family protein [Paenibacillus sp. FSL H8-0104]|uniref:aspartyl-phosphate phosphatase Spo0E family protein n=1 Tax=Paenibacillus sp. FSL H8-0104 TaxID=2954509 RepID=UPI0030FD409D
MKNPSSSKAIQNQILILQMDLVELRSEMVRIGFEFGLHSKEVIEASQKLDIKINQHMALKKQLHQCKKPTT